MIHHPTLNLDLGHHAPGPMAVPVDRVDGWLLLQKFAEGFAATLALGLAAVLVIASTHVRPVSW